MLWHILKTAINHRVGIIVAQTWQRHRLHSLCICPTNKRSLVDIFNSMSTRLFPYLAIKTSTSKIHSQKHKSTYGNRKCLYVAGVGPEPTTSGLWIRRSNQLSYPAVLFLFSGCKGTAFFSSHQEKVMFFFKYPHFMVVYPLCLRLITPILWIMQCCIRPRDIR